MERFEYKVVPAPERGKKAKGARTASDRFANALESVMNELAQDGWEYHRADTLPSEERSGLTGKTTIYRNMLVFRRLQEEVRAQEPIIEDTPEIIETPALPAPEASRQTEAMRARSASLRAVPAPASAADAAATAAAALRMVGEQSARPAKGTQGGLVHLMGERRKTNAT